MLINLERPPLLTKETCLLLLIVKNLGSLPVNYQTQVVVKEWDDNDYHVECETYFFPTDHHEIPRGCGSF
jgi:hypothetical protein